MGLWTLTGTCPNFVNVKFPIYFENNTDINITRP